MTDKEKMMTDNEIIKTLERIAQYSGFTDDVSNTLLCALDLINRQQAEIERLKQENNILSKNADTAFQDGLNETQDLYAEQVKSEVKSEAIKEFAERLKNEMRLEDDCQYDCMNCYYECKEYIPIIDNLVNFV